MTSRSAAAQHMRDLAWLHRVRDRIDREYAQPLNVEALPRGAHLSAGHRSRQFRRTDGESPYAYVMTRRIERAMALLRGGDRSVTGVCFAVGCASLDTFSSRFTELGGGAAQGLSAPGGAGDGGDAAVGGQTGDQTGQESRSAGTAQVLESVERSVLDTDVGPSSRSQRDRHGQHHPRQLPPARRPGRPPGLLARRPQP